TLASGLLDRVRPPEPPMHDPRGGGDVHPVLAREPPQADAPGGVPVANATHLRPGEPCTTRLLALRRPGPGRLEWHGARSPLGSVLGRIGLERDDCAHGAAIDPKLRGELGNLDAAEAVLHASVAHLG